jgi:hypothetical protein
MTHRALLAVLCIAAAITGPAAAATTYTLTPATWAAFRPATLACGDVVQLAGAFPNVQIRGIAPTCPVTLDLAGATVGWVALTDVSNVTLLHPTLTTSVNAEITLTGVHGVTVTQGHLWGCGTSCITVVGSTDVVVQWNALRPLVGDGIDIVASQRVTVRDNTCVSTTPSTQGTHQDCLQAWDTPTGAALDQIDVEDDTCVGHVQCFSGFWAAGMGPAPFEHITLRDNVAATDSSWAAGWNNTRDSSMAGNLCYTTLTAYGPKYQAQWMMTDNPAMAPSVDGGGGNTVTGNLACIPPAK